MIAGLPDRFGCLNSIQDSHASWTFAAICLYAPRPFEGS